MRSPFDYEHADAWASDLVDVMLMLARRLSGSLSRASNHGGAAGHRYTYR